MPFPPRLLLVLLPPPEIFDGEGKPVKDLVLSSAMLNELGRLARFRRCAAVGDWATRESGFIAAYDTLPEGFIAGGELKSMGEPSMGELARCSGFGEAGRRNDMVVSITPSS